MLAAKCEAPEGAGLQRFRRVMATIVALENYRRPSSGDVLPSVAFAHADADAIGNVIREIFTDMPSDDVIVDTIKDSDASLTAVRDHLAYTIRNLSEDDLFIFYYAGHGFHGSGGNRLSAYDTNHANIGGTSLLMRDDLLEPLARSACKQALVFVDACADQFREVVETRDVIANLDLEEAKDFFDNGWYLGVFLSCSPGEKSYPDAKLGHGIWTYFLLEALSGRADGALIRDRWLTDYGLRDYLRQEVPRFITRETQTRGKQTPQAILSGSNSFRIRYVLPPPAVPADAALAGITLRNNSAYLEGTETGLIRGLDGFRRGTHMVPSQLNDSADNWCRRLLMKRVAEELQNLYTSARNALRVRRKDIRKEEETGAGGLDTPAFRYTIESGQNPDDPAEYFIKRRLELRHGWTDYRDAIGPLFGNEFKQLVIEFESIGYTFDDLVDRLEDIQDTQGGDVDDDDRHQRVSYQREGATFTFDLHQRRLEISFGNLRALDLVDAAQKFQLGIDRPSPMLAAPAQPTTAPAVRAFSD